MLRLYAVHRLSATLIDRFGARFGFSSLAGGALAWRGVSLEPILRLLESCLVAERCAFGR